MIQNNPCNQETLPYANLLSRLEDVLSAIDLKTRSFQIDYPKNDEVETVRTESDFEMKLRKIVECAEYINSKLPF